MVGMTKTQHCVLAFILDSAHDLMQNILVFYNRNAEHCSTDKLADFESPACAGANHQRRSG